MQFFTKDFRTKAQAIKSKRPYVIKLCWNIDIKKIIKPFCAECSQEHNSLHHCQMEKDWTNRTLPGDHSLPRSFSQAQKPGYKGHNGHILDGCVPQESLSTETWFKLGFICKFPAHFIWSVMIYSHYHFRGCKLYSTHDSWH